MSFTILYELCWKRYTIWITRYEEILQNVLSEAILVYLRSLLIMHQTDSINQSQVEPLLTTYGWLPQSKVGQKAAGALFLVIQHANLETMQRYLPVLKKAVEEGEASATSAALMEDRILTWEGKRQLYGTQASGREQENGITGYFIWPIKNPEEVNNRRAEVGFGTTVEENAARLNATYNPDEELP